MFTVPGWSLPAKAETQTTTIKKVDPVEILTNAANKTQKNARKRKDLKAKLSADPSFGSASTLAERSSVRPEADNSEPQSSTSTTEKPKRKKQKRDASISDSPAAASPKNAPPSTHIQDGTEKSKRVDSQKPVSRPTAPADSPFQSGRKQPKLTPLQLKMKAKLTSARFRHLNETLYTKSSEDSLDMISHDPTLFVEYHDGFSNQVSSWPENPVDGYARDIIKRGSIEQPRSKADKFKTNLLDVPLPRDRRFNQSHIVDLGAGTAPLAQALQRKLKPMGVKLSSFDLHSTSPLVQVADIKNLPLRDGSVDVAIFCLSLMGTNWLDFIDEAYRVLRWKGELWIAEVKSRFSRASAAEPSSAKSDKKNSKKSKKSQPSDDDTEEPSGPTNLAQFIVDEVDNDGKLVSQTDVSPFVNALAKRGFVMHTQQAPETGNKMFVKLWFVKGAPPAKGKNVGAGQQFQQHGAESSVEVKKRKGKFLDDQDDGEDENKLLKACVYKIR